MPVHVEATTYGAAAYQALRRHVAAAKRQDPLAPVTLLAPNNLCGVIARRALARGCRDGRPGIAGLTVATVLRLAELMAAPTLGRGGRRPVTGPVLAAAWRQALAAHPGGFAPVADHPATVRALVEAHRQLRDLSDQALDAIAHTTALAGELVRLHRAVVSSFAADWYDTTDLLRAAARGCAEDPAQARELGTIVLFLPERLHQAATDFVGALADAGELRVIAGLTGVDRADADVRRILRRLGVTGETTAPATEPATATRVLHASDPDDEVRCVVREVVETLATAPAHRVAVLYSAAAPYARLLHEHLSAAGVTVNGVGVRPVRERALARAFLDLLALSERGMRRDDLFRVLTAAPIRDASGMRTPASRWERISRQAGVIGGDDWEPRLRRHAGEERHDAAGEQAAEAPSEVRISRHRRDAEAADELREFTAWLRSLLARGESATTWQTLATWALEVFHAVFGDEDSHVRLPETEARAAATVGLVLRGLAGLDKVEPTADLAGLRQVLELELGSALPRLGRFGEGVLVAPLAAAVGLDADVVFAVGLAEDLLPGRHQEDPLLPDPAREATRGGLPAVRDRLDAQHRRLLAAFAAAPRCVASFPRGDLRRHSLRLPSRWLLPTLRALSGDGNLPATGWDALPEARLTGSPSYAGSLTTTDSPASEQEWRVRATTAGVPLGDAVVDAAAAMLRARDSDEFTRYDGNLAGHDLPDATRMDHPVSPTSLERWATCPHAYFVSRLLGVEPVAQPEEIVQTSPLDIGTLVHESFDAFVKGLGDDLPGPGQPWTAAHRDRLLRVAEQRADALERRGVTGHPRLWRRERARILADLMWLLDADSLWRAERRAQLVSSELVFGMSGVPPVQVPLPDGRARRRRRGWRRRTGSSAAGTAAPASGCRSPRRWSSGTPRPSPSSSQAWPAACSRPGRRRNPAGGTSTARTAIPTGSATRRRGPAGSASGAPLR